MPSVASQNATLQQRTKKTQRLAVVGFAMSVVSCSSSPTPPGQLPSTAALWISNSGETLVYLSSTPLACGQLASSRWLGSLPAGAQVFELVIKGAPQLADYAVPPAEVNYAEGGKSSSYENNAKSGKITYTKADAQVVEGSVTASYSSGEVSGTFHADFCAGGQEW